MGRSLWAIWLDGSPVRQGLTAGDRPRVPLRHLILCAVRRGECPKEGKRAAKQGLCYTSLAIGPLR